MKKYRVLYNPYAGGGKGLTESRKLCDMLPECELDFCDITGIESYDAFFASLLPDETLIISGGDGTLNRFINDTSGIDLPEDIMYYACGTGNDFLHDLGMEYPCVPFPVKRYLDGLPEITVNGMKRRFLNGIGYGIDGYCTEEADRQRESGKKRVNYTLIALKGLLGAYRPVNAEITVDGVTRTYEKVWLAPTMKGRFFGGGMMISPGQDRLGEDGSVTVTVAYGSGKLKTLTVFPSIFNGTHMKHTEMIDVFSGYDVTVRFDRPTALQIDGETVRKVTEYSVKTAKALLAEKAEKLAV